MLSNPADFPFFNDCTAAFTSLRRVVILCVCLGTVHYRWISIGPIVVQLRAVFCPSVQYLSFFHEAFFSERPWTVVTFPCFTVVKSFTSWYALLPLFFLRFSSISLHSSPIQFSLLFSYTLMLLFTSLYCQHVPLSRECWKIIF